MAKSKHTGINTGTIIRTRGKFKTNAHVMEHCKFCNTCINYNLGKCDGGDIKGLEIEDISYADRCSKYKFNPVYSAKHRNKNKKK